MTGRSWDEVAANQAGDLMTEDEEQDQLEAIEQEQELAFELAQERDWED